MKNEIINLFFLGTAFIQQLPHQHRNSFKSKIKYRPTIHIQIIIIPRMTFFIFFEDPGRLPLFRSPRFNNQILGSTAIRTTHKIAYSTNPSVEIKQAAAPSPNIERLLLSDGCKYLLYVSAVSNRTFRAIPAETNPLATAKP